MKTNCFNVMIHVKCVPGDDHKAISEELEDVLMGLDILPYDYEVRFKRIGLNKDTGLRRDVDNAVKTIIQRFNSQSIYTIDEFLDFKENKVLIESQAYLCSYDVEAFKDLVRDSV